MTNNTAIIIKLLAGTYTLYDKEKNVTYYQVKPRGVLKLKGTSPKVGDVVVYEFSDNNNPQSQVIIKSILPRKNDLIRPFISNIDQAIIVFSVKEPELNLNLLDKFLVTLEYNNIKPIIIFSKWDLLTNHEEINNITYIKEYYESIGYKVLKTSINDNLKELLSPIIKDKISVLTGQSGVGKSSILNTLDPTINIETNEISQALNRGKHTTRHVELFKLFDGMIADTPGFGTIDFTDIDEQTLSQNFVEFFKLSSECKYNGCLHLNEPNCKVKQELQNNHILKTRYDNYLSFINIIKELPKKY